MKFRFKIQQYQTDAVDSVVRVFAGQPYHSEISYRRDVGEVKPLIDPAGPVQLSILPPEQSSFFDVDPMDDTGYLNETLMLSDAQLLHNIHEIQQENNIRLSAGLIKTHGRCSLDVEMETGTGKTYVSQLQYTVSVASQREHITGEQMRESDAFGAVKTKTNTLKHTEISQIKYDLVGKIAEGTVLTRRTVTAILKGIDPLKFSMFQNNPEEFITKDIRLIREQKATMIVEHITYDTIEGGYDSSIFTAEKHGRTFDQAFPATKAIQDYVFTDGTAEKSVERKFVEALDGSQDVNIYAKLPKGFAIPTPVGHYSPDWAIVFHEGAVRHIYFVAETKGTMDSLNLRPIEKAKIDCAKKLFSTLSNGTVTYDHVDSFQQLMNKVMQ